MCVCVCAPVSYNKLFHKYAISVLLYISIPDLSSSDSDIAVFGHSSTEAESGRLWVGHCRIFDQISARSHWIDKGDLEWIPQHD